MLKLIIEDDEGRKTVVPFVRDEITVGRQEGNTIRLTERNVSRKHARLLRQNGHVVVEDLGSYNGIRVNGEKIDGKHQVHDGDLIQIGDYDLAIQTEGAQADRPQPSSPPADRPTVQNAEPVTEAAAETADPEDAEPTAPQAEALAADARRQATSVIRVDQIEGNRKRDIVDIDASEAPRLVVLNTEFAGREFSCIRSELKIGRTEDNDIGIDHRSLSRTHAKVVRESNGEWRVIDMQSANGTAINGETYAQAALRSGDVITLGHVKIKFVAPGDAFRFVPGKDYDKDVVAKKEAAAPGSSKTGVFIGGGIAFAALVGAGVFLMTRPPSVEPTPKQDDTIAVVAPPKKDPAPDEVKVEDKQEPEPQIAGMEEKIAAAKSAMEAREFDKAADILNSVKGSDGVRPKQVESLLDEVNAEILFKKNLATAEKALSAGKLDEAARLVEESGGTLAYAEELTRLKTKVDAAKKKADDKLAAAQKKEDEAAAAQLAQEEKKRAQEERKREEEERKKEQLAAAEKKKNDAVQQAKSTPKASKTEEAKKLYEEGFNVLKSKQYAEAASIFRRCLEQDPKYAKCHLYLGVSYAKLKQVEKGAYHYKQFVTLAPNDEETPKVRKLIEQYEQSKKSP